MGLKFTLDLEGAQKFTAEMHMADTAAQRLGTTLAKLQQMRGAIPGLATPVPTAQQFSQGNFPGVPNMGGQSGAPNWRLAGLGAMAGVFSPWIGATMMNQSGILGQGAGAGALGKLLGGAGVSGFGVLYLGISVAAMALKAAFESLANAVKRATQLFFEAAKLHTSPGQLAQSRLIGRGLGLSDSESYSLAQSMAYGRGHMNTSQIANLAGMSGQQGAIRYLKDLSEADKKFWDQWSTTARDFHVLWTGFTYDIEKLVSVLTNALLPILNDWLIILNRLGPALTEIAKVWAFMLMLSSKFTLPAILSGRAFDLSNNVFGDSTKGGQAPSMTWRQLPMSAFERMGFVIGNSRTASTEYQRQIAMNTSHMVSLLSTIAGFVTGNPGAGIVGTMATEHNAP